MTNADLKEGLGKAAPRPGGHVRHARGFRVKDGGAQADGGGRNEHERVAVGPGQHEQPHEGQAHAHRQRMGHRPFVGDQADDGLEQGRGALKGEGDPAELRKAQAKRIPQHGINGGQECLDGVIQQMGKADGEQHRQDGGVRRQGGIADRRGLDLDSRHKDGQVSTLNGVWQKLKRGKRERDRILN